MGTVVEESIERKSKRERVYRRDNVERVSDGGKCEKKTWDEKLKHRGLSTAAIINWVNGSVLLLEEIEGVRHRKQRSHIESVKVGK